MNFGILRLVFAAFWLLVAAYLLRSRFGPDQNAAWADPQTTDLFALFAFALVVWNVTRWYTGRRPAPVANPLGTPRRPLEPRRDGDRHAEYHPEFDFTRTQDETGG